MMPAQESAMQVGVVVMRVLLNCIRPENSVG